LVKKSEVEEQHLKTML